MTMTILNITVFNNKVLIDDPVIIPEGNYNTIFAVFTLPDEWNGLTAKVKFGNFTPLTIPRNKTVAIPLFDTKGDISVKVFAYSLENDEYSLIYSPTPSQITVCDGSFDDEGETPPVPPTPGTEYLDKTTLWDGYSAYFETLTDAPADAVTEFESVDITSMTLEEVVTEIEVINKMILDAHSGGGVSDVEVNGQSVVYDGVAQITIPPTPTIPVEDVKVNGSSVVDNQKVANVTVPTNYVTTDTEQEITASKTLVSDTERVIYHPSGVEYFYEDDDIYRSFEFFFPSALEDGSLELYKDDEACIYKAPKFTDGDTYQIAVTDDIPTNYMTTDTNQTVSGEKTYNGERSTSYTKGNSIGLEIKSSYRYAEKPYKIEIVPYFNGNKYEARIQARYHNVMEHDVLQDGTNTFILPDYIDSETLPEQEQTLLSEFSPLNPQKVQQSSSYRFVTDAEKTTWNGKANVSDIPTNNNQLINGAGYQTASDVSTAIANNQFIAMYSKNVNDQWECNKTFAEIEMAILNKKEMIALVYETVQGNIFVRQYTISAHAIGSSIVWDNIDTDGQPTNGTFTVNSIGHISNGVVFVNASSFDFTLKEDVANKVTLIDSTSPSNTKYPSESAVVTYMNIVVGDINTTLDMINGTVI